MDDQSRKYDEADYITVFLRKVPQGRKICAVFS